MPRKPAIALPPARTLGDHVAQTLVLAVPVMFSRIGLLFMVSTALVITGQAGGNEQAYLAASFPPHMTILVIGIGLMLGVSVLSAQAHGAGRSLECGRIWRLGLLVAAVFGGISIAIMLFGQDLLRLLDFDEELASNGGRLLWYYAFGMPAMLMYVATTSFLESIGRTIPGALISFLANAVNIPLCWILVFGELGLPAMGADGAALALSISRWCMVVAILLHVRHMSNRERFGVHLPMAGHYRGIRKLLRVGGPLALATGLESVAFATVTIFAGWLGPVELAAYQDALNVNVLVFMLGIGLATATSVRVANAVGRGDQPGLRRAGWVGAGLIIVIAGVAGLLIAAGSDVLAAFFHKEPEVRAMLAPALIFIAAICMVDGLQAVLIGATRGTADTVVPTVLQGISFLVVMVPAAYFLGFTLDLGLKGLFQAVGLGLTVASLLLTARFYFHTRRVILPV